tara:strand:+ start:4622 stop:4912 length:291 start_codon:yes stop_codon:yes gene_type:complete
MTNLDQQQIKNFFKKSKRFFDSHYPLIEDENGLPTLIKIEAKNYSLTHGIDRHDATCVIISDLRSLMGFNKEESIQLGEYYVHLKYSEYKDFILSI